MAKIVLVTAANEQTGEAQRESRLGEKPFEWCKENLKLQPDPIPLDTNIEVCRNPRDRGGTQQIFVRVDEDEDAARAGLYASDASAATVRDLLRA